MLCHSRIVNKAITDLHLIQQTFFVSRNIPYCNEYVLLYPCFYTFFNKLQRRTDYFD